MLFAFFPVCVLFVALTIIAVLVLVFGVGVLEEQKPPEDGPKE